MQSSTHPLPSSPRASGNTSVPTRRVTRHATMLSNVSLPIARPAPRPPLRSSTLAGLAPGLSGSTLSNSGPSGLSSGFTPSRRASPELSNNSDWFCHPLLDSIVHVAGCYVCTAFIDHAVNAELEDGFQRALKERSGKYDAVYRKGFEEGRRRQNDDDAFMNEERLRYRQEAESSWKVVMELNERLATAREDLKVLEEQLALSRTENDRLQGTIRDLVHSRVTNVRQSKAPDWNVNTNVTEPNWKNSYDQVSHLAPVSLGAPGQPKNFSYHEPDMSLRVTPGATLPSPFDLSKKMASYAHVASSQTGSQYAPRPRPYHQNNAFVTSEIGAQNSDRRSGYNFNESSQTPYPTSGGYSTPPFTYQKPRNIRQLQSLMRLAHSGNEDALALIKMMCAEAHSTPRELKTSTQFHLLNYWRNPFPTDEPLSASSQQMKYENPRKNDRAEVWYNFLCRHQTSWPRGVRRDAQNRPLMSDLRASRIIAQLRPSSEPTRNVKQRQAFMTAVCDLFETPGRYKTVVEESILTICSFENYKPYEFEKEVKGLKEDTDVSKGKEGDADVIRENEVAEDINEKEVADVISETKGEYSITMFRLAQHFAMCGVTFELAEMIEQWVPWYKASVENRKLETA